MSTEALQEQNTPEVENPVAEQVDTPEVETTEVAAPVSDAAFEAGFSGVEETPEPEPEPQKFSSITEDQLKELLAKAAEVDKLKEREQRINGTLGSLKQSIDALRNQPKPTATQVQLTKEAFKKTASVFPEIAEMLAEDLNGVLTARGASPVDPSQFAQVENKFNERLQQSQQAMQQQFESKVLTVMHPDWKQVVPSPEFQQWKQTLPQEVLQELDNSWDAEFIGFKLNEFKDWKSKAVQGQAQKKSRLEAAITPRGGPIAPTKTIDDAFIQGFKEAKGVA
jgi:hypothetical protein